MVIFYSLDVKAVITLFFIMIISVSCSKFPHLNVSSDQEHNMSHLAVYEFSFFFF